EQYRTPPLLAADLLFRAQALGDIVGRRVLDLGCGTGMFTLGAALLGASEATGVDVDAGALQAARQAAEALKAPARFEEADVARAGPWTADTVIQNPPFGAQVKGADRPFLAAALKAAPVVYSLHLTDTGEFVIEYARKLGAELTHAWDYEFPIRHQFKFHTKAVKHVPVTAFRFTRSAALS
ncbi:MAG TPA: METTL5 family protein, partial [Candidatus Thermoplasmatota archaeon]|nr:METTL5 family protein [Candidatus Thermoplasmatota archaeon]